MKWSTLRPVLAAVAVLSALGVNPGCGQGPPGRFVVLVIMDTVRRDALGCYGHAGDPTPSIDWLASEGIRFDHAVSTSGWTLPSVASIVTGNWPSIHGALGRGANLTPIRPEMVTAAEVMKQAGYNTAGYANAAFVSPRLGFDRGFDVFDHVYSFNETSRRADETMDAALQYIREHRGEDCFLLIHLFDAHLDYDPPGQWATRFTDGRTDPPPPLSIEDCLDMEGPDGAPPAPADSAYIRGVYEGEVGFVDAQIGRLGNELMKLGLFERSLVVVTSDHGEEFWDHGGFEHGHTLYQELVHVPLIVKFPSDLHPPKRVHWQVRLIDVMPTVFDYLGISKPETFAGESLMPYVRNVPTGHRNAFSESLLYGTRRIAWRTGDFVYIQDIEEGRDEVGELYNWRADPDEHIDIAADNPEITEQVRRQCMEFYFDLLGRARTMSPLVPIDMSPDEIDKLKSLGYVR